MKKDFLAISDYSPDDIQLLLNRAVDLKKEYFTHGNKPILNGKVLGMIFQKPSLRTRVSFDMAMRHVGGDALYLSPNEIGLESANPLRMLPVYFLDMWKCIMARVFDT